MAARNESCNSSVSSGASNSQIHAFKTEATKWGSSLSSQSFLPFCAIKNQFECIFLFSMGNVMKLNILKIVFHLLRNLVTFFLLS